MTILLTIHVKWLIAIGVLFIGAVACFAAYMVLEAKFYKHLCEEDEAEKNEAPRERVHHVCEPEKRMRDEDWYAHLTRNDYKN